MVISRNRSFKFTFAASTLFMCMQSYAAEGDYLNMELDQLMQVPVSGSTLRDESLKTVPSAVTIFTHDQLEKLGIDYLYELLSLVPGYQVTRSADNGANYTFSSRGRRNGSLAREIMVVMDGRPLANPRTGSADVTLPFIPLEQIERVEIIRGPGSSIYGSSAFSGVINIVSRTGQNAIRVEAGSDQRRGLSLMGALPVGDWEGDVFARAYKDAGQDYNVIDTFSKMPIAVDDPRQTIDIDLGLKRDRTQFHVAYHRTQADDFYTLENTKKGFNTYSTWLKQFSVEQGFTLLNNVNTRVYLGYLGNQQNINVAVLGAEALAGVSRPRSTEPLLTKVTLAAENYNLRITNDWSWDDQSNGLLGIEWKRERETQAVAQNNYDLGQLTRRELPITYYGNFDHETVLGNLESFNTLGIFGQYQRNLGERTGLTLGLRYDKYDDYGGHTSPRVGIVHQLTENQTLKLLYGDAYRTPSLSETDVANNPLLPGGNQLELEMVKTWDLIWMGNWNNTSFSVSAFRNSYRAPILAGFAGTSRTFLNSEDETSDGASMEAKQYFTQQWSVRATYTNMFNLPKTAFREAEQLGSFEINFNEGPWNWNLLGHYQDHRYTLNANNSLQELNDFWVFNTKLRFKFLNGFSLSAQLKNMTNLDYVTPSQGTALSQGVPNRGRELSVIVARDF